MTTRNSLLTSTVDFSKSGLQRGHLRIPHSSDRSAYGFIGVPIWQSASERPGPTLVLTGANHGDEYEGPIALIRLWHEGSFDLQCGRVIVIPALNFPAFLAGRRTSPIDGINLNRSFPGNRNGTLTEMLAHYLESEILPLADVVIDLHAGGGSLDYLPTLMTYPPASEAEREELGRLVAAFAPPRELVMSMLVEDRVIGAAAKRCGALFLTGEFGGGGTANPAGVRLVMQGLRGVMQALGLHPGPKQSDTRQVAAGVPRYRVDPVGHYVYANRTGLFEPRFQLGDHVVAGQLAGVIYDLHEPWRQHEELFFEGSGEVMCTRTHALVEPGDCLAHLAAPMAAELYDSEA